MGVTVDGYAPATIGTLTIEIRTRSGRLLGSADAPNAVDDERPGSDGGMRLELGSFHQQIVMPGPIPTSGWQVEITWRDGSDGSSGSAFQLVPAIGP